ncbi:MAG: ribosome small subunit-dependent GTPase A [Firmicutes bacterium]|nr:ribosome small subunit-dependent GTPase A [Bacillota bacterium]
MNGIIIKGIGGFYYVRSADKTVYECRARGVFRKDGITPMIGDRVEIDAEGKTGSIVRIAERKNSLIRPPVANIDALVIVAAAASPSPSLFLIDKMILNAEINGIEPIICINKTDLADGRDIEDIYKSASYRVFRISVKDNVGIDDILPVFKDKVTAFSGLSGVGKSSLLNRVAGINTQTGGVSEKIQCGKNTTRHVELFELKDGGYVLDTPGFSSFEPENIDALDLWRYFPEMADAGDKCRFRGCSHINEPDCAVKALLQSGAIRESRYESYKEIYEILKNKKGWTRK